MGETPASVNSTYLAGAPQSMDATSTLPPLYKVESLRISTPTPPSSETNIAKQDQPDVTKSQTVDIPPPPFINSISELRSLSTALSTFLLRYDELHNHINSIMSSIDSKLPNHLLDTANPNQSPQTPLIQSISDHAITTVPETTVLEQNPNVNASNCERSHEIVTKPESPKFCKEPEETDTSMNHGETDISKEHEETDTLTKHVEADTLTKHEETDVSKEPEQTDTLRKHEETDMSKEPEETDISKEPEETDTSKEPEETDTLMEPEETDISKEPEETDTLMESEETDISKEPEETDTLMESEETDISKEPEETDDSKKAEEVDISKKPAVTEIESYCERMCGRDLKRYASTHISDMNKLRKEIPKALKLAKDPAKLVLHSIGRFFIQGSAAYSKNPVQVVGRLAAVVILECFGMINSDGIEIAKEDEEYAAKAAVAWRKRMINEGGLGKTEEVDARGLLLLISGFGIPDGVFKNVDIWDLIRVSNVKEISIALRRSIFLIPKIPEVINWMVKNKLEIEAADIAYTFGLEDKCHPEIILTTFLHSTIKEQKCGSSIRVKEAMMKQLSNLKSIRKCLEAHKVDPANLFPDFKVNEKIQQLEKEAKEIDIKLAEEKATEKRKAKEVESSRKPKQQEPKRTRLNGHDNIPQQHKAIDHFDRNLPGDYISPYSASRAPALPVNITSSVPVESVGGMLTGTYGTGVYGGTYLDRMVNTTNGRPYGWHEDSALVDKYLGQPYSRQDQLYDSQPSTTSLIGLYRGPSVRSSLESFPGMLSASSSAGFSARGGTGSDLYSFADKVVKDDSYRNSRASGSGTTRSPYLY